MTAPEWCPNCGSAYGIYDSELRCNGCGNPPPPAIPGHGEEITSSRSPARQSVPEAKPAPRQAKTAIRN